MIIVKSIISVIEIHAKLPPIIKGKSDLISIFGKKYARFIRDVKRS